jgi:hypothetical protein
MDNVQHNIGVLNQPIWQTLGKNNVRTYQILNIAFSTAQEVQFSTTLVSLELIWETK